MTTARSKAETTEPPPEPADAVVIGAGPAGLMAAQALAECGRTVVLIDAKAAAARKFLMAGKSGLNLCKDEPLATMLPHYYESAPHLEPMLRSFDAQAVQAWARGLGQEVFTGSSGRVFPRCMKASPLLRAWLAELTGLGVAFRWRWRWRGFEAGGLGFDTPEGHQRLQAPITVLALGGASWARLGADGHWRQTLQDQGIDCTPFAPSNAALRIAWSDYMRPHFGQALKNIALRCGPHQSRGECVLNPQGLEGSGVYAINKGVREGEQLHIDLFPDKTEQQLQAQLQRPQGKASRSKYLRQTLNISAVKSALLREFCAVLPDNASLAPTLKQLPITHEGLAPLDKAISTAGGLKFDELDGQLMLKKMPGVYCVGEMLDWDAPTGGYLITASLATGRWAGKAAAKRV